MDAFEGLVVSLSLTHISLSTAGDQRINKAEVRSTFLLPIHENRDHGIEDWFQASLEDKGMVACS